MANVLQHRGPDDSGLWLDADCGVALGHRRLAIVDLSPEGHQPMISTSGRYVIVFNGEIYNFEELRSDLGRVPFRGHSDTEVMLAAFDQWGIERAVGRFNGMFAFALWDRNLRQLYLCRDRIGEKPLYYGWVDGAFVFASELKSIRVHPRFDNTIDRDALALFMRHGYIASPYSIYKNIYKLPPAGLLTVKTGSGKPEIGVRQYWSARQTAEDGCERGLAGSEQEMLEQTHALLSDSVRLRMVADVPVGAFLSGGIDSSLIVALMQAQTTQPVRTFSIGFHQERYNEAHFAKAVANRLGCTHTELYVTPEETMAVIPRLPHLFDEPFADSSQIPTFLVSELARRDVTVSLSGDGGDELFGGYNRYRLLKTIWQYLRLVPVGVRRQLSAAMLGAAARGGTHANGVLRESPRSSKLNKARDRLVKLADLIGVRDEDALYLRHMSHWQAPSTIALNSVDLPTALTDQVHWAALDKFLYKMMYRDLVTYLPDGILVKVDRASMGVSLESRIPLLDHRLVELSWRLPMSMKMRNAKGKWVLRQLLKRYIPEQLFERPKTGFGIPVDEWLRGPLREWAEDLLGSEKLRRQGYLSTEPIRRKWAEHVSGAHNWIGPIWNILMFQAWLAEEALPARDVLQNRDAPVLQG